MKAVAQLHSPPTWVSAYFRVTLFKNLRTLWLLSSPYALLLWALGFSVLQEADTFLRALSTSHVLRYHLGVLVFRSLFSPFQKRIPCRNGATLQHTPGKKTRSFLRKELPFLSPVPLLGFGYPFSGLSLNSLRSIFQLRTLMGFSLQSLAPLR